MEHPLIRNARRVDDESNFDRRVNPITLLNEPGIAEQLTRRIMEKFPDLFTDLESFMETPCAICYNTAIPAKSVMLKGKYSMELAMDNAAVRGMYHAEELIVNIIAGEIGCELSEIKARLQAEDKVMCPYIVVFPVKSIDHSTFQPVINFKTRYGIYDPNEVPPES